MDGKSPLMGIIDEFIAFKIAGGYKYKDESRTLMKFGSFLSERGIHEIRIDAEIMGEWCKQGFRESRKSLSNRVAVIRQFTIYTANRGYPVAVPDTVRKAKNKLFVPYVFNTEEIQRIFHSIDNLPGGKAGNSHIVYPVLFRILYGCGLRVGEALALRVGDVDLANGILTIRHAKNDKMRMVSMSSGLTRLCSDYYDKYLTGIPHDEYFLRKKYGGGRSASTVTKSFRTILWRSGIPYYGKGIGPRLHDLRHTFCCHSLKQMSEKGIDLYCALPVLSAYLGHSSIKSTEQYLRLTAEIYPELVCKMGMFTFDVYPEVLPDGRCD